MRHITDNHAALNAALEEVPAGVFIIDPLGNCRYVNRAWSEMAGIPATRALGAGWLAPIHPEDREQIRSGIVRALKEGSEIRNQKFRYLHSGGEVVHVSGSIRGFTIENDAAQYFIGSLNDITAQTGIEEKLLASEKFLDSVIENIPMMIFIKEAEELRFTRFNLAGEELLGMTRETLLGKNDFDFFPPEEATFFVEKDRQVLQSKEMLHISDEPISTNFKGRRILRTKKIPLSDSFGRPRFLLGISEDVTDEIQAEEALRNAKEAAEEASKLKSKFLAIMSHEMRTPLNSIIGMSELLLSTTLNSEQHSYLETVKQSGMNLLELINDILDFSRIEAGKLEIRRKPCSIRQCVDDLFSLLKVRADQSEITFVSHVSPELDTLVLADQGRLRQVLLNLLGNALKFTPKHGVVQIQATALPVETPGILRVRFLVEDTGIGIPPAMQSSIFDPFTQLDNARMRSTNGTGLGLAISAEIVEAMGGIMTVVSEPGKGSIFSFTIQFDGAPLEALPKLPESAPHCLLKTTPEGLRPLEVLIAEDDQTTQRVMQRLLERTGCKVQIAGDGRAALEAVEAFAFDLILLDVQLPVLDGVGVTQAVREKQSYLSVPIIGMSTNASSADKQICLNSGMTDYIPKPFDFRDLFHRIENLLAAPEELDQNDPRGW